MIILIGIIVGILIGVLHAFLSWDCYSSPFIEGFIGGVVGLGLGALIFVIACAIDGPEDYKLDETFEIQALNDATGYSSSCYLFSGYSESKPVYRFIYQDELGIRTNEVNAKNTAIIYTDEQPKVEVYDVKFANPVHRFLAPISVKFYKFYIPEGAIKTEYTIDLQ